MQRPEHEPLPVVPLDYRDERSAAPWLSLIGTLAILCIIDGSVKAFYQLFRLTAVAGPYYRGDVTQKVSLLISFLLLASSASMIAGAIGSLRRRETFRRLTVVGCVSTVAFLCVSCAMDVTAYFSRGFSGVNSSISVSTRTLMASMLPIAISIIFSSPPVKSAFEAH